MMRNMKNQFLLLYYEVQVFKGMQNVKQGDMDVATYTDEFCKLSLSFGDMENERFKVAIYLNLLK